MNERIKELMFESGLGYMSSAHPILVGKFAELIVKECIGAISEVKESFFEFRLETDDFTEKIRFFAGEDACNQSVRKIETLFGVEE